MHQDQRIGLALGVLLLGACAAFFFRNESRTGSPVPRLKHAQELDDRIAERPTRPYLKGIEAVEAGDRRRSPVSKSQESPDCDHTSSEWSPLDSPGSRVANENSFRNRLPRARLVDDDSDIQELDPIAIPNDSRVSGGDAAGTSLESSGRSSRPKPQVSDAKVHVVQKGETLSSIAVKTLGSPNRFHEIFEANQDQLRDPNDLKLGMTLRIPDTRQGTSPKSVSDNARSALDQNSTTTEPSPVRDPLHDAAPPSSEVRSMESRPENQFSPSILIPPALPNDAAIDSPGEILSTEESAPTKKFVPSRRTPPPARPIGPQAKNVRPQEVGGRRLTQASLESTSGKVAR